MSNHKILTIDNLSLQEFDSMRTTFIKLQKMRRNDKQELPVP
jgi:hypothetical protein